MYAHNTQVSFYIVTPKLYPRGWLLLGGKHKYAIRMFWRTLWDFQTSRDITNRSQWREAIGKGIIAADKRTVHAVMICFVKRAWCADRSSGQNTMIVSVFLLVSLELYVSIFICVWMVVNPAASPQGRIQEFLTGGGGGLTGGGRGVLEKTGPWEFPNWQAKQSRGGGSKIHGSPACIGRDPSREN